jgi:hypothetical protein
MYAGSETLTAIMHAWHICANSIQISVDVNKLSFENRFCSNSINFQCSDTLKALFETSTTDCIVRNTNCNVEHKKTTFVKRANDTRVSQLNYSKFCG